MKSDTLTITEDGFHVDEDGVVVKHPPFQVVDVRTANEALEKISWAEAEATAVLNTAAVIQARAVLDNAVTLHAEKFKRIERYRAWLEPQLQVFAQSILTGKSRTWKSVHGSISLRNKPEALKVRDKGEALALCKILDWENAIKTSEEFQISKLEPHQVQAVRDGIGRGGGADRAFILEPETDTVTVKTGVS